MKKISKINTLNNNISKDKNKMISLGKTIVIYLSLIGIVFFGCMLKGEVLREVSYTIPALIPYIVLNMSMLLITRFFGIKKAMVATIIATSLGAILVMFGIGNYSLFQYSSDWSVQYSFLYSNIKIILLIGTLVVRSMIILTAGLVYKSKKLKKLKYYKKDLLAFVISCLCGICIYYIYTLVVIYSFHRLWIAVPPFFYVISLIISIALSLLAIILCNNLCGYRINSLRISNKENVASSKKSIIYNNHLITSNAIETNEINNKTKFSNVQPTAKAVNNQTSSLKVKPVKAYKKFIPVAIVIVVALIIGGYVLFDINNESLYSNTEYKNSENDTDDTNDITNSDNIRDTNSENDTNNIEDANNTQSNNSSNETNNSTETSSKNEEQAIPKDLPGYNGAARYVKDGKYGFVDYDGKVLIPFQYDFAWDICSDDLNTAVMVNGKWGIINSSGNYIYEPQFDVAFPPYGGVAAVIRDGQFRYLELSTGKFFFATDSRDSQYRNAIVHHYLYNTDKDAYNYFLGVWDLAIQGEIQDIKAIGQYHDSIGRYQEKLKEYYDGPLSPFRYGD